MEHLYNGHMVLRTPFYPADQWGPDNSVEKLFNNRLGTDKEIIHRQFPSPFSFLCFASTDSLFFFFFSPFIFALRVRWHPEVTVMAAGLTR
jgi:hypothetical protein